MPIDFYRVGFEVEGKTGAGVWVFQSEPGAEEGTIVGADAAGNTYTGKYQRKARLLRGAVEVKVPMGAIMVNSVKAPFPKEVISKLGIEGEGLVA